MSEKCQVCKKDYDREEAIRVFGESLPFGFCSSQCFTIKVMTEKTEIVRIKEDRESQIAWSGSVAALESLLEFSYIKIEDIPKVKQMIQKQLSKITIPDVLESIKESRFQ